MKKILVVGLFFASLAMIVVPGRGFAQQSGVDISALQAQIQALLAMIQQLQNQLNAMQSGGGSGLVVPEIPATRPSIGISVGDRVQSMDTIRVRSTANGVAVSKVGLGTKGTVVGNSVWKDGYWWAEIYWDNRVRGFSAEDFTTKISMPISGVCGDLNGDGVVNIKDTTWIKLYATGGAPIPMGTNADMNGDGAVNVLDQMSLENYVLRGGAQPSCTAPSTSSITVTSPSGGEVWSMYVQHTISWTPDSNSTAVEAYLEKKVGDSFVNVGKVVPVGRGSIVWNGEIDTYGNYSTPPGFYYIRVHNPLTGQSGRSAALFQLVNYNSVTAVSIDTVNGLKPTGVLYENPAADVLSTDTTVALGWSSRLIDGTCQVRIYDASTQGGTTFVQNLPLNGEGKFNLPPGTGLYYIAHVDCSGTRDASGSAFVYLRQKKVEPSIAPLVTITSPGSGSTLNPGTVATINWLATGGGFDKYQIIVGNTVMNTERQLYDRVSMVDYIPANQTSFLWNVPDLLNDFAKGTSYSFDQIKNAFYLQIRLVKNDSAGGGYVASSNKVAFSVPFSATKSGGFVCGDVDQDGLINSDDLTKINEYVFGGLPITDNKLVDLNVDGVPDIIDVTLLANFVNRGGVAPSCGGQGAQAPTITSLTGPTIFYRSSDKTWLVTATDPEGSAITYSVDWGDGEKSISAYMGASGAPVSITHRYSTGGKPIIKVTATDSSGLAAVKSMRVEVGMANLIVTDFWGRSGASIGLVKGDTLIARDGRGVFSGLTTVGDDGVFILHAYGDDPITVGFDDGLTSGETVKFYKDTTLCTLISGSAVFSGAVGSSKEIALNCSGSAAISTPSSLASIGDQLNGISQTLIGLLGQLGM